MGVSKHRGTRKSSMLIRFSIINHPFWGFPPIFGNIHIWSEEILPWLRLPSKLLACSIHHEEGSRDSQSLQGSEFWVYKGWSPSPFHHVGFQILCLFRNAEMQLVRHVSETWTQHFPLNFNMLSSQMCKLPTLAVFCHSYHFWASWLLIPKIWIDSCHGWMWDSSSHMKPKPIWWRQSGMMSKKEGIWNVDEFNIKCQVSSQTSRNSSWNNSTLLCLRLVSQTV